MYINPFLAGVLSTIGVELVLVVAVSVYYALKTTKK